MWHCSICQGTDDSIIIPMSDGTTICDKCFEEKVKESTEEDEGEGSLLRNYALMR